MECLRNAISVKFLPHHKGIKVGSSYPICNDNEETAEHALFHCNHVRGAWFLSLIGLMSHNFLERELLDWWKKCFENDNTLFPNNGEFKCWIVALRWAIWKVKHDFLFNGGVIHPHGIIRIAKSTFIPLDIASSVINCKVQENIPFGFHTNGNNMVVILSNVVFRKVMVRRLLNFV